MDSKSCVFIDRAGLEGEGEGGPKLSIDICLVRHSDSCSAAANCEFNVL